MRTLRVSESLAVAHVAEATPDWNMPFFNSKADTVNILDLVPSAPLRSDLVALQRISFLSTEWLAIRLLHGTKEQCLQFCLCLTALRNADKNASRSVVVEVATRPDVHGFAFACAPLSFDRTSRKKLAMVPLPWVEHAHNIAELAHLIMNETCLSRGLLTAELQRWCRRFRSPFSDAGVRRARALSADGRSPSYVRGAHESRGRSVAT